MTDAQRAELIAIVTLASSTNALANALQVPVVEPGTEQLLGWVSVDRTR